MQQTIPAWMLIPFALQLLCIAILPLTKLEHWWEKNTHKLLVSIILGLPVGIWLSLNGLGLKLEHQMVYDYIPFILLLAALFVTTGGICIRGDLHATPLTNTAILALGFVLASFMGTTGAAMLLIRLLIKTNSQRKYTTHTILFFIAAVANCGGLLSPLGDPPLFLLFQKGAPFEWFMGMWKEWATTGLMMLGTYYVLDTYWFMRRESAEVLAADRTSTEPIRVTGRINFLWLMLVILATMFINPKYFPAMGGESAPYFVHLFREFVFFGIIVLSLVTTKKSIRQDNDFTWTPILEVACVFCGIFATMTPALMYLEQHPLPITEPWQFVYSTGMLSAFLDNAPTAMVFHATASTLDPIAGQKIVAGVSEVYLRAICMGAVFFGSLTYIGNGPNFMIKSIAEQSGFRMPSFFVYMFKFSLVVCLPIYIIVQWLFL